jgi:hypothetical protein
MLCQSAVAGNLPVMVLPDIDKFRFEVRLGLFSVKKENRLMLGSTITATGISCFGESDPPQDNKDKLKKIIIMGCKNLSNISITLVNYGCLPAIFYVSWFIPLQIFH